jgi:hypothetical protein
MPRISLTGIFCLAACVWQLERSVHHTLGTANATTFRDFGWHPLDTTLNSTLQVLSSSPSSSSTTTSVLLDEQNKSNNNTDEESFSACLLIKDDNHWLIEWLAYHYHVLPLRELIVVRDPASKTSSTGILNRWNKDQNGQKRMNITEWMDDRILPRWIKKKVQQGKITAVGLHRYRQQFFYGKCLQEFKARNQTWVLLSDVDEFVRPNPYSSTNANANATTITATTPLSQPGSVLKTLQQHAQQQGIFGPQPKKCLHVPRIQMATKEVLDDDDSPPTVPVPLLSSSHQEWNVNASHFLTTRWLFHNGQEIRAAKNLNGKNIVNVATLQTAEIPNKVHNVHFVIPGICPATAGDRLDHADSWLLIQHYAGTFEQYSYRDDPRDNIAGRPRRMSRTTWQAIGQQQAPSGGQQAADIRDDAIVDWLPGFVESVGASEAARLLAGVGAVGME